MGLPPRQLRGVGQQRGRPAGRRGPGDYPADALPIRAETCNVEGSEVPAMERGSSSGARPDQLAREPTRPAPSLAVPAGWSRSGGSGWSLLADAACDERLAFAFSLARGLEERPRSLDFRWLYDDRG